MGAIQVISFRKTDVHTGDKSDQNDVKDGPDYVVVHSLTPNLQRVDILEIRLALAESAKFTLVNIKLIVLNLQAELAG